MFDRSAPIVVARSDEIDLQAYPGRMDYIRRPYLSRTVLDCRTDVPINTSDVDEGRQRSLPDHETIQAGVAILGPGAGEAWHTHLSYYDAIWHVSSGQATLWWADGEGQHEAEIESGDFFYIAPNATHQWLNSGDTDLKLVMFAHYHNFRCGA